MWRGVSPRAGADVARGEPAHGRYDPQGRAPTSQYALDRHATLACTHLAVCAQQALQPAVDSIVGAHGLVALPCLLEKHQ